MKTPNLSKEKLIAIDIETYDPGLIELGPGVYRGDGYILGVAISTPGGFSEYYPLRGDGVTSEMNAESNNYLKDVLALPVDKLGANILYDVDWLENYGWYKVNGKWYDIQIAESLLDENQGRYSLDFLSKKYLNIGKRSSECERYAERHDYKGDFRKHLYKMPLDLVSKYALGDTENPIRIFEKQKPELVAQGLVDVFELETKLQKPLLKMRAQGVRIDLKRLSAVKAVINSSINAAQETLNELAGYEVNANSSGQLAKLFDKKKIEYQRTPKGNPNLDKYALKKLKGELPELVKDIRHFTTLKGLYLDAYDDFIIGDRIHAMFNQVRRGGKGTVTGRLSASQPNLQQISKKSEDLAGETGKLIRELFIPEDGMLWYSSDYSQIEYRIFAHYASGPGSDALRQSYNDNPSTDYHAKAQELTGIADRGAVKNQNFGTLYGMGVAKTAEMNGWTLDKAKSISEQYHSNMPFIKVTSKKVEAAAIRRGYIKTVYGRRRRLTDRAYGYKMLNALIQGTAADVMKKAICDAYDNGIMDTLPFHITVHDELDYSVNENKKEHIDAVKELENIMTNAVEFLVPLTVNTEKGPNWGKLSET